MSFICKSSLKILSSLENTRWTFLLKKSVSLKYFFANTAGSQSMIVQQEHIPMSSTEQEPPSPHPGDGDYEPLVFLQILQRPAKRHLGAWYRRHNSIWMECFFSFKPYTINSASKLTKYDFIGFSKNFKSTYLSCPFLTFETADGSMALLLNTNFAFWPIAL